MYKMNAYEAIRILSGMFNYEVNEMSNRLYYCNLISRYLIGDADEDLTKEKLAEIQIELDTTIPTLKMPEATASEMQG